MPRVRVAMLSALPTRTPRGREADAGIWRYALPVAALGWLVAFHSLLYAGIIPEAIKPCGQGPSCSGADMTVLGLPLPYLSLLAFTGIAILLVPSRRKVPNV